MSTNPEPVREHFATLDEWLGWLETLHPKKIDLSLSRLKTVLNSMGMEKPPYRVVTIGGTNGKGSCVAILESIYAEAGYRVGAFTSPHLWAFNERVRVDRVEATDEELIETFCAIDAARGDVTLSYFEYSALAAIALFARSEVDVALLEVGLGGRLDAVNAIDPDASLIVSIDLDHEKWLGDTRDSIAAEKAGILRHGRPGIVADRDPPNSLLQIGCDREADLKLLGRDFEHVGPTDAVWQYDSGATVITDLPAPPFGGLIQLDNAAACVAVVQSLTDVLPVAEDVLARGIRQTRIAARLERHKLDGVEWVFDVAHNPAAARVLADELERNDHPARTIAVFAAMSDKDIGGVIEPLIPLIDSWVVTQADPERGATESTLLSVLAERRVEGAEARAEVDDACDLARRVARKGDRVLVFGSCYMVGPAMTSLGLYCAPSSSDDRSSRWTGA